MPSTHSYAPGELPAQFKPDGYEWLRQRLLAAGRKSPAVYDDGEVIGNTILRVNDLNISKNQLLFEVQPSESGLTANQALVEIPHLSAAKVAITGPAGKTVKVKFEGFSFLPLTTFVIPQNNNFEFQFGPAPLGARMVVPQTFVFYVEDGSCSPVAVSVLFK